MAFLLTDGSWFPISPLITVMKVSVGNKALTWKQKVRMCLQSSKFRGFLPLLTNRRWKPHPGKTQFIPLLTQSSADRSFLGGDLWDFRPVLYLPAP